MAGITANASTGETIDMSPAFRRPRGVECGDQRKGHALEQENKARLALIQPPPDAQVRQAFVHVTRPVPVHYRY
jgi:hypothetical protein